MGNQYSWLVSPDKMIINGVSSDTVGLTVDTPPMPPLAEEIVDEAFTFGRAESTVFKTGQYKNIEIAVKCYVLDYGYQPDQIYKYISGAKTLAFSSDDRYFYKVKKVLSVTPAYQGKGKNVLNVRFQCSPFKYNAINPEYTYTIPDGETSGTAQIYNAGSVYCEPMIWMAARVIGSGTSGVITVNGETVTIIPATSGEVYFDIPNMEVYTLVGGTPTALQSSVSGKWWEFILPPGYSEISWSGGTAIKITKNERWL